MIQNNLSEDLEKELEEQLLFEALSDELNQEEKKIKKKTKVTSTKGKKHSKSNKSLSAKIKKGLSIKTVIMLLMALLVNTYAWFLYVSRVDVTMNMHVQSWDVLMEDANGSRDIVITIEHIYPGFNDDGSNTEAKQEVTLTNSGQMNAAVTFNLTYMQILDDIYVYGDSVAAFDAMGLTPAQKAVAQLVGNQSDFLDILDDLPFTVEIMYDGELYDGTAQLLEIGANTTMSLEVKWPYETGTTDEEIAANDEIDTNWGEMAYDYYQTLAGGDGYSIIIKAVIEAVQTDTDFP